MTARRSDDSPQGTPVPHSPAPVQPAPPANAVRGRKTVPLRLDPAIYDALARWAADELRSVNAQIDITLRRALSQAGRLPRDAKPPVRRGRPRRENAAGADPAGLGESGDGDIDDADLRDMGDETRA